MELDNMPFQNLICLSGQTLLVAFYGLHTAGHTITSLIYEVSLNKISKPFNWISKLRCDCALAGIAGKEGGGNGIQTICP